MNKIILDVRSTDEFSMGNIEGSINMPVNSIKSNIKNIASKETYIIVYCATGSRSSQAKMILNRLGFNNVSNGINMTLTNEIIRNI